MSNSFDSEALLQRNIIEVMQNEVKNKEIKWMPCCMNIARKVAEDMGNVTPKQVLRKMLKMMDGGMILYTHTEPPYIILKEHYDELMLKERHEEERKKKNQKLVVLLKRWLSKIFSAR